MFTNRTFPRHSCLVGPEKSKQTRCRHLHFPAIEYTLIPHRALLRLKCFSSSRHYAKNKVRVPTKVSGKRTSLPHLNIPNLNDIPRPVCSLRLRY